MARSSSSCACPMAASSSRSRRLVIPESAECTMSTRAPAARRAAATRAMLFQLGRPETLVPPNFSTIQAEGVGVTAQILRAGSLRARTARKRLRLRLRLERAGSRRVLELVVEVFQVFLKLSVRQHFFEPAPGSFAALALIANAFVYPVEQPVVIGAVLGGTAQEFFVEIEALVVSFRHLAA